MKDQKTELEQAKAEEMHAWEECKATDKKFDAAIESMKVMRDLRDRKDRASSRWMLLTKKVSCLEASQ